MDAAKLRNIIFDLTSDSEKMLTELLNTLANNISANQSTEISSNLSKIETAFNDSIINEYNPSNLKIIKTIGATPYFGISGYIELNKILNKNTYNVQQTVTDLQKYVRNRTEFINVVHSTGDNLTKLNIRPHYHADDTFEIGLLMPKELTKNKIINITKELNHWDKVFKTLKELTIGSVDDTEINFVNNGSLEFFIDNGPQIATCLAITVERIIKLYKNIIDIRNARLKLKELGVSQSDQKVIEKQEKEILGKGIDSIATDIVKEFAIKQIDAGRVNELKIAVKGHITYIAKCIDNGMIIEITPPEISEPEEVKETDTDEKKKEIKKMKDHYEKTLNKIEIVQKSMDTVKTIGKTGGDILNLLNDVEDTKEE